MKITEPISFLSDMDSENYTAYISELKETSSQEKIKSLCFEFSIYKRLYLALCDYSENNKIWYSENNIELYNTKSEDLFGEGYYSALIFEEDFKVKYGTTFSETLATQKLNYLEINEKDPLVKCLASYYSKAISKETLKGMVVGIYRDNEIECGWVFRRIK